MSQTNNQYHQIVDTCKSLFISKMKDYGSSWRIMRPRSVTDQLFIKAQRIQSIELKGEQKIADDIKSEFIGLVNYGVIGLIQLKRGMSEQADLDINEANEQYSTMINAAFKLMELKNHDYGEAWRGMRISSYTDLILMKIYRIKQIEDNSGQTIVSEGIDANYLDIINYSIFALIKLQFANQEDYQ